MVQKIFGPDHEVYVGVELTKKFEAHYRDSVDRVIERLSELREESRLKGEISVVLSPFQEDQEYQDILKAEKFNPNKDGIIKVNIMKVAERLNEQVEMHEGEFRDLLGSLFPEIPSYHIGTVVRLSRKGKQMG